MKQTLTMRKANLQKAKFSTLFFVLLTILSLQSKAQLFNEDFDYSPAGDSMTNHGWSQIYGGATPDVCVLSTSGLTYQGYANTSIGLGARLNGSQAIYRTFADSLDNAPRDVYASFLVNVSSVSADSNHFLTSFFKYNNVTKTIRGGLWVKADGVGGINFGASKARKIENLTDSIIPYSATSYDLNTTYLVVLKYRFNADSSDDEVSLWINPSTIGTNEDPNPIIVNHTDTGETDLSGISGFVLFQKANEFGTTSAAVGLDATIDAIQIDTVWANLFDNTVLPVKLLQLTAKKGTSSVDLNWKVNNETALSLYQVERSSNGKEFSSIGTISSSNTSSNVARAFTDNKPMADNFYRLKMVDQNGSYQYSQTLRVSYDVKSTILLYPTLLNKGMFTLQMSNQPKGDYKIDITNTTGQKIQHLSVVHNGDNSNQLVTLSKKYEPGMYIVVVTSPTGNKYTNRIIIQ